MAPSFDVPLSSAACRWLSTMRAWFQPPLSLFFFYSSLPSKCWELIYVSYRDALDSFIPFATQFETNDWPRCVISISLPSFFLLAYSCCSKYSISFLNLFNPFVQFDTWKKTRWRERNWISFDRSCVFYKNRFFIYIIFFHKFHIFTYKLTFSDGNNSVIN